MGFPATLPRKIGYRYWMDGCLGFLCFLLKFTGSYFFLFKNAFIGLQGLVLWGDLVFIQSDWTSAQLLPLIDLCLAGGQSCRTTVCPLIVPLEGCGSGVWSQSPFLISHQGQIIEACLCSCSLRSLNDCRRCGNIALSFNR